MSRNCNLGSILNSRATTGSTTSQLVFKAVWVSVGAQLHCVKWLKVNIFSSIEHPDSSGPWPPDYVLCCHQIKKYFLNQCECFACIIMFIICMYCLWRPENGVGGGYWISWTWVIDWCEPLCAKNWTCVSSVRAASVHKHWAIALATVIRCFRVGSKCVAHSSGWSQTTDLYARLTNAWIKACVVSYPRFKKRYCIFCLLALFLNGRLWGIFK